MVIVIYLDIVLLINVLFNFILLSLTSWILKRSISTWRILLGTIVATSFIIVELFLPYTLLHSATANIFLSFVIVFTTFGKKHLLKNVLYFYFISFIIGGGTIALHSIFEQVLLTNPSMFVVQNSQGSKTSLILLLASSVILFFFTKKQLNEHTRDQYMYKQQYDISITLNGLEKKTVGHVDSGNHLIDTLSGKPVIVCDEAYLQQFFNDQDWQAIRRMVTEEDFSAVPPHILAKISIVPYQGVGGDSKYLYTFKIEGLTIELEEEKWFTNHVLVGIQLHRLIGDQSYHCLLHPDLLQIHALQVA